jgi:hypothetical protein
LNNTSHTEDHCRFDGAVIDKIFHSNVAVQLEQEIENAVIVDAWTNTVKRARDGIKYIKEFFNFNPEKEDCIYSYHRNS